METSQGTILSSVSKVAKADGASRPGHGAGGADAAGKELTVIGDALFAQKQQLNSLWQIIAEELWPYRATFTKSRILGDDFSRNLGDSKPAQNLRDLGNVLGEMTRPPDSKWFRPAARDAWRNTEKSKAWFDKAHDEMRAHIYSKRGNYSRVFNVGDWDLCAFGNAVSSMTENSKRNGFINVDHHLKDVAWSQNNEMVVDHLHRKMQMTLRNIRKRWGMEALSKEHQKEFETNPFKEIEIRHAVLPVEDYLPYAKNPRFRGKTYASVYYDPGQARVLEEAAYFEFPYVVRRWFVTSDSPYGHSPAAMLGLIDARLLQAQTHVILDAAERKVDPPLLATRGAILGEVSTYAGSITWLDEAYDEKLGAALRPLETGADIRLGLEMKTDTRQMLDAAMFINKLSLPQEANMTAYEVGQRLEEYLRTIKPVVRPFRADNTIFLDLVFSMLMRITVSLEKLGQMGPFSPLAELPDELKGADIDFEFDGPVEIAFRRAKRVEATQVLDITANAMKLNPGIADNLDSDKVYRDAILAGTAPQEWLVPIDQRDAGRKAKAQQAAQEQQMAMMERAAGAAKNVGQAAPGLVHGLNAMQQAQRGKPVVGTDGATGMDEPDADDMEGMSGFNAMRQQPPNLAGMGINYAI